MAHRLSDDTSPGIYAQANLTDFFVNLLHELNDEIYKFMFVHCLGMEVGDEERDVISLNGVTKFQ